MKKSIVYLLLIGLMAALSGGELLAQYKIERWVIGSGGMVEAKSTTNIVSGMLGQLAIEKRSGTFNGKMIDVYQGFWVPNIVITDVDNEPRFDNASLSNFPNPVSNLTTIRFQVPTFSYVTLKVYDVVGNVVKVLFDGYSDAGIQDVSWDTRGNTGLEVSSGSYLYELSVNPAQMAGESDVKPFTLRNIMVITR